MKKIILSLLLAHSLFGNGDTEHIFTDIYKHANWGINEGGTGFSGPGSTLPNTSAYIAFLEDFMRRNNIRSVVDAGCGDWTFSKEIDWGDIQYLGVDVVKGVIDEDIRTYGTDKIRFEYFDLLRYELPAADLLICKDVLMHLSNRDISYFLKSIKKFKHCLFTHDFGGENENTDIERGGFRPLDLTKPPFYLSGIKILTFETSHAPKQILYHGN